MQQQTDIPLHVTHLSNNNQKEQLEKVENALQGLADVHDLKSDQVKELRRLMTAKGITIEVLLDKYKAILDKKEIAFKGSDVLKALERLEKLLGLTDKSDEQLQIKALTQTKTANEITTTLIEITGKTQDYLDRLQKSK